MIWNSDEQADWFLAADTDQSLEALLRTLWDVDSLAKDAYSNSESCEKLLTRLRRS